MKNDSKHLFKASAMILELLWTFIPTSVSRKLQQHTSQQHKDNLVIKHFQIVCRKKYLRMTKGSSY